MAIPVYLQQFKSAGIYRVVFDKSSVAGVDSETLRLVVGYSEKGPFNIPTYVKSVTDFKAIYGDISKKLEKRGIYFHRLALQCLEAGPILALNLKKFSTETVNAISISPEFNAEIQGEICDIDARDIYDTTRFWEISAEKLNSVGKLDRYIKMSAIGTTDNSNSFFMRKASGSKVSSFNLTVKDWFAGEGVPDNLERYANNMVSDFFAEVYVFGGEFKTDQVLTSNSLKNYFDIDSEGKLQLKPYVVDGLGRNADTLDALFADETANPLGHYVGCVIPNFKDKMGVYASLDILFNLDEEKHNMMMTFDSDAFENGEVDIDLSGRKAFDDVKNKEDEWAEVFAGTKKTNLLLNKSSLIVRDKVEYNNLAAPNGVVAIEWNDRKLQDLAKIEGTIYVNEIVTSAVNGAASSSSYKTGNYITVKQLVIGTSATQDSETIYFDTEAELVKAAKALGVEFDEDGNPINERGTYCKTSPQYETATNTFKNIDKFITMISRISKKSSSVNLYASFVSAAPISEVTCNDDNAIYGSSVSFLLLTGNAAKTIDDYRLASVLTVGDCLIAHDGDDADAKFDNIYVQEIVGSTITLTGVPFVHTSTGNKTWLVRIDKPMNQEIGIMKPTFLKGYTFAGAKPAGTSMSAKIEWRNKYILSVLTDEVGVRTALLDKANIDYRYVVDTFESFVEASLKNVFCGLCKEKQSAFAILNFPAVKTFIKCPYSHYTDSNDVFNVQYIVDGLNKKKPGSVKFSLPTDFEGASFGAFYTPLKFSDGYVDTMVPSAGLVSNRFMEKYTSRKPYYIVAGPNYAKITYTDMIGPDYTYSREELNIIEPYGVNCMVYRPGFGTFINANQTAKQTPVTALSRVNVRELVIYLQDEVEKVLQAYQWEFNNPITRNAILTRANSICANIAANGGIQAYLNVMDESNNTPDIIDNEMAILSTSIEPGFGCGKMVHELTIYGTGKLSAMITEQ